MRARIWLFAMIVAVLLSSVAWYLGSPLFASHLVDKPFPGPAAPATSEPAEQISR
jgi:hypothetical protein